MNSRKSKICMNAMVANESHVILRMLESCYRYIDYWVIQDNGSTDGTQDIIRNFFSEKNIPGFLYEVGWEYPGWNRNHTLQECLKANHGCDWILRMDADEQLEIDDNFDWSLFDDHTIQSFNVTAISPGGIYYRTWFWNARLPWYFKEDRRHEVIHLPGAGSGDSEFQIINLPKSFRHVITNDGQTWGDSLKFLRDALELETDQICNRKVLSDDYHLFYIGKSYNDTYEDNGFPFGKIHGDEYARRCIFYFDQFVKARYPDYQKGQTPTHWDEMVYLAIALIGRAYYFIGDMDSAEERLNEAELYCGVRNEHLVFLAELYEKEGRYDNMYAITTRLNEPERVNPFPEWYFLIYTSSYHDTGSYVQELHRRAMVHLGIYEEKPHRVNTFDVSVFPGEI